MPQLGESVAEGTIGRWLKQPGDTVAKYEPLVEVITDKVNAEVPSPFAGVLKEILAEEGATVPNDAEIAVIETEDEALAGGTGAPPPVALGKDPGASDEGAVAVEPANLDAASSGQTAQGPAGSDGGPGGAAAAGTPGTTASTAAATATGGTSTATAGTAPTATAPVGVGPGSDAQGDPNARMTPAVRRLLREHGLEAGQITGTGGGGRIPREDVLAFVEAVRTGTAPAHAAAASNGAAPTSTPQPAQAAAAAPATSSASAGAAPATAAGSAAP